MVVVLTQIRYKLAECYHSLLQQHQLYRQSITFVQLGQSGHYKTAAGIFPPLFHVKHQSQSSSQVTNSLPPLLLALRMMIE